MKEMNDPQIPSTFNSKKGGQGQVGPGGRGYFTGSIGTGIGGRRGSVESGI